MPLRRPSRRPAVGDQGGGFCALSGPHIGDLSKMRISRLRPEECSTLRSADLRALVPPDAEHHLLADGTVLRLAWQRCSGCWGPSGKGKALLVICPGCGSRCRLLRRPPAGPWGCWRCRPLSTISHRRSGAPAGRGKPATWQAERLEALQARAVLLAGVAWPPPRWLWARGDLEELPLLAGAPRLSARRRAALLDRIDALQTLKVALVLPAVNRMLTTLGGTAEEPMGWPRQVAAAHAVVAATRWAVRRPAGDRRQRRPWEPSPPAAAIAGD